jgi:hypothetical protein
MTTIEQSTTSESKSETLDIHGSSWFSISPSSLIFDKNNNSSANKNLPVSCGTDTTIKEVEKMRGFESFLCIQLLSTPCISKPSLNLIKNRTKRIKYNNSSANKNLPVSCGTDTTIKEVEKMRGFENSTNQDHHHCLQYLEQLCRNITNRDVPRCAYNNQKIESAFTSSCTQYPLCGIRNNDL